MKKLLIILFAAVQTSLAMGQCRSFVKNNCGDAMEGFIPGESFNAVKLFPGDAAEVEMTFYSDVDYRLLVCSHEVLSDVHFQLVDKDGEVVYDNADREYSEFFDFRLEGTRTFGLKIKVPDQEDSAIKAQGCVAILLGRKLKE
ncbi:hypothetical protein O3Q51_03775 [Cryomorphaceae bacterium 1068]|nr:hypothetical protein [Cryomorphaceae bacterium 1068]